METAKPSGAESRRAAVFALARWLETADRAGSRDPLIPEGIAPSGEHPFVQDIVYTAVKMRRAIDFILSKLVKRMPGGEMRAILQTGAAQLFFMRGRVPDFAAVNETVAAAKATGRGAAAFANAVLRNCVRKRAELDAALAAAPLAVRESFPDSLVRRWTDDFGAERAEALCKAANAPAGVWLARPPPSGFEKLPRGTRVEAVAGYAEGAFIVQDPATAGAIELLDVRPGMRVLDFCAAPGGKSAQILWRLGDSGELAAMEVNPTRRERLAGTLRRVHTGGARWRILDSPPPPGEVFDRVLVDAPCSNTGVLRRRPDARWRWSEKKTLALAELQSRILSQAAEFVAPGGKLVYSTCSIDPRENGEAVRAFAAQNPAFSICAEKAAFPDSPDATDGAYACALAGRSVFC